MNSGNVSSPVTWSVDAVSGSGNMHVYTSATFGGIQRMVFAGTGSTTVQPGVHAHANWAFSQEGIYRITMTQTATLANGKVSSDTEILTIVVGDVDPRTAAVGGSGCAAVSNSVLYSDDAQIAKIAAEQVTQNLVDAARNPLPDGGISWEDMSEEAVIGVDVISSETSNSAPVGIILLGTLLLLGTAIAATIWYRRRAS